VERHVAKWPNALPAIRQRARQTFVKPWYASNAVKIMATHLNHMGMLQPPTTASHPTTIRNKWSRPTTEKTIAVTTK
jgi:hypothetical protein